MKFYALSCRQVDSISHYSPSLLFLGKSGEMGYGRQRVWGTIGFGIAALLAGYTIDLWSQGDIYKTYTPAFLLVFVFTCIDLICCKKLQVSSTLRETQRWVKQHKILFLFFFHFPLCILLTAATYFRINQHIKRCIHAYKIKTHRYIFVFRYTCWYS